MGRTTAEEALIVSFIKRTPRDPFIHSTTHFFFMIGIRGWGIGILKLHTGSGGGGGTGMRTATQNNEKFNIGSWTNQK